MTTATAAPAEDSRSSRLALLLAMAMFVLVVDTSLMNVSISAVVRDLDTTASGVQSAIALEALVSAAFILLGSKVADLIGRKRAYVMGLLGYAIGALSMVFAQNLVSIIICWAIIGGIGASLLLPSMQSLIHGNFEGAMRKKAHALVGASAAIAAAVGPLLGGFITTYPAGVNSAAGSFGLSFGLAFAGAIMLAVLSLTFTNMANDSTVLAPAQKEQVSDALEHDAEVMSNTRLEEQLAGQPEAVQDEIVSINTDARHYALQIALIVPLLAGVLGFLNAFRMLRLRDPEPSAQAGELAFG
jgi:MFS family permease